MKNLYFLLLIIVSFFTLNFTSNSQKLDDIYFQRTLTDYKGVVAHENTILTYGDYGILTISFDLGENWEQKYLGEKHNINQIIKTEFGFYGVSNFAVFYSHNFGKSWRFYNFEDGLDAMSLSQIGNNICVLTNESILFFDLSLNFQKRIDLEFNKRPVKMIANDRYLFITDSTRTIRRFDTKTDIDDYVYIPRPDTIYTYSNRLDPFNFFVDNQNNLLVEFRHISINLFSSANNGEDWDLVSGEFRWYNGRSLVVDGSMYNIYGIYRTRFDKIDVSQYQAIDTNKLTFKRFEKAYHETVSNTDSSIFDFNYNANILNLIREIRGYTTLKDSIIVLVGKYSSILMSYDFGKTWVLKSFLNNQHPNPSTTLNFKLNESKNYLCFYKAGISHSYNFGATWMPQNIDSITSMIQNISSFNYIVSQDDNVYLARPHEILNNNLHKLILSKSENKLRLKIDSMNFDYLRNQSLMHIPHQGSTRNNASSIFGDYFFEVNNIVSSSITFVYDKHFDVVDYIFNDTLIFSRLININDETLIGFINFRQKVENNRLSEAYFTIISSQDFGKTWQRELDVEGYVGISQGDIIINDGNILFNWLNISQQKNVIVEYDINLKQLSEVLNYPNSARLGSSFIERGNKYLFFTPTGFYINHYPKLDLTNWEYFPMKENSFNWLEYDILNEDSDPWSRVHNTFISKFSEPLLVVEDKIEFLNIYGSTSSEIRINFMKVLTDPPLSVEHSETETPRSRAFLHAGKPYPLPAVSTVSADLHWNAQYSASEAILKVFDSMGNEIPNANVELQQTNPYSGTVTWDCGTYPTGIYFIQITIGTEQKNVGVAVVR